MEIAHAAVICDRTDHLVGFEPDLFSEVCRPGDIFRPPIPCPFDRVDEITTDIARGMFRHRDACMEVVGADEVVVEDRTADETRADAIEETARAHIIVEGCGKNSEGRRVGEEGGRTWRARGLA